VFKVRNFFAVLLMGLSITGSAFEDPTRPPLVRATGSAAASIEQLPILSSIVYSEKRRLAVVNGHLLSEGESKEGIALLHVAPDNVRVRLGGASQITLRMSSGLIKKELK
jgi:MSHA biogenesis protein MshK